MAYDKNYGYAQNGYTQYLDNSGKPLTGGSIETYIAGTTTPVLTFKEMLTETSQECAHDSFM